MMLDRELLENPFFGLTNYRFKFLLQIRKVSTFLKMSSRFSPSAKVYHVDAECKAHDPKR